jgi:hypothetical protein
MTYLMYENRHGVMYRGGPRKVGPHKKVFDTWPEVGPTTRGSRHGPVVVVCEGCWAEWPEGGSFPERCA